MLELLYVRETFFVHLLAINEKISHYCHTFWFDLIVFSVSSASDLITAKFGHNNIEFFFPGIPSLCILREISSS